MTTQYTDDAALKMDWAEKRTNEIFDYFIVENAVADDPSLFIDIKAALVRELRKAKADGLHDAAELVYQNRNASNSEIIGFINFAASKLTNP